MKAKQWLSDNGYSFKYLGYSYDYMIEIMDQFLKEATEQPSQPEPKFKDYECSDCHRFTMLKDNREIRVGFCQHCGHPLWNDLIQPSQPVGEVKTADKFVNDKLGDKNYTHSDYPISRKELADWLNEFHTQFPKVVLPSEEQIEARIRQGLYTNIDVYPENVFRLAINWIKSLNK